MTQLICNFIDFVVELSTLTYPDLIFLNDFIANLGTYMQYALDLLLQVNFLIPVPLIVTVIFIKVTLNGAFIYLDIVNWVIRRVFDVIP